jgi:diacylglycerol kinase family enzyme
MAGIGVVLNPRSRRNLRDPRAADRLARALGDHGVVRTARSRDDLARIATDYRKLGIDVLGISGGDGTNHVTITGFLEAYADETLPPIALLRGGTMNTVANSLGVPRGGPDGLLRDLAARYANRTSRPLRSVERHVMRVGPHVGFLFGTGAIHGFLSA